MRGYIDWILKRMLRIVLRDSEYFHLADIIDALVIAAFVAILAVAISTFLFTSLGCTASDSLVTW
jgi:hypothetical protein